MAEAGVEQRGRQEGHLQPGLKRRHMTMIAISELVMRRRLEREAPDRLILKMWLYPWLTYLSIFAMVAVLIAMAVIPDQRPLLIASVISALVILVAYLLRRQFGPPEKSPDEVAEV
jgi:GABA permease